MILRMLFLIGLGLAACSTSLLAQAKCRDYACMMEKARKYLEEQKFKEALNSATAAKRYSKADDFQADALIEAIFTRINNLREEAEAAKTAAQKATEAAEAAARKAENASKEALKAKADADRQRDSVLAARAQVEALVRKGKKLENTFSDSSAYEYLYQTGLQYFEWDKTAQRRDYQNALTYFALARFLRPSDTLDHLVLAAQYGIRAEADFINGALDSAQARYAFIRANVDSASLDAGFERHRTKQIEHVNKLYQIFCSTHKPENTVSDTLAGNWWTLPADFKRFKAMRSLVFTENSSNFRQFPTILDSLPELKALTIANCPRARNFNQWKPLSRLQTLVLKNNPNLFAVEGLDLIRNLLRLDIDNCQALTFISGCSKLEQFSIKNSPQARVFDLLQDNPHLKNLELADLPGDSLKSEHLTALQSLSLARMNIRNLNTLGQNACLDSLKVDSLSQLQTFTPPACLSSAYIRNCDKLRSLASWPASDSLHKLLLYQNNGLMILPEWQHFSKLKKVLILDNHDLRSFSDIRRLKNAERIYIMNNPNLVTNSIHAGFGFDWGVYLSSIKLEFEHRRAIRGSNGQDIGFKAVALYSRKEFKDKNLYTPRNSQGWIGGLVLNYYSPSLIYAGLGIGLGQLTNRYPDQPSQHHINFVWINNLGCQFAPYFLKKDKVSVNMDLYTIFEKGDYYILPSFGLTYYYTLGLNNKTYFIRRSDVRTRVLSNWKRVEIDDIRRTF